MYLKKLHRKIFILLSVTIININLGVSQNNFPYPVIFVHGSASGDNTWEETFNYLKNHDNLGATNVFDVVLNADNDNTQGLMSTDVKWDDFTYSGDPINVGKRNYATDMADFVDGWTGNNIFAINFKEERFRGATGFLNDYFDQSNESAIYKQGMAIGILIDSVLTYTGKDKVVLVAHSMGGLAIREYLQRVDPITGSPSNWVFPSEKKTGHRVARVVTYGSPHVGQNSAPDPTRSDVPNVAGETESNRDMIWEYDGYTGSCDQLNPVKQGLYLFGGAEQCVASSFLNATFPNVDINCNGSENDTIIGVCKAFNSFDYNPNLPLPLNIKYTYITSIWGSFNGITGDGLIDINRQFLRDDNDIISPVGISDTIVTNIYHTSQPKDYVGIITGMDEPEEFSFAYELNLNEQVIGYTTRQMNGLFIDTDTYKSSCTGSGSVIVTLNNTTSFIDSLIIYDDQQRKIKAWATAHANLFYTTHVPINSTEIFVKLIGTATQTSYQNPYKLKIECGTPSNKGTCLDPIAISCGVPYYGDTYNGTLLFDQYSCASQLEEGREKMHKITITDTTALLIELKDLSTDLDIHLLASCDQNTCIDRDDNTINLSQVLPGDYYILVDGFGSLGQHEGTYTLLVSCSNICNTTTTNINDTICSGEVVMLGTTPITSSGLFIDTLVANGGCDSIVNLNLKVQSSPSVTSNANFDTINVNENVIFTANGSGSYTYDWQFGDGFSSNLSTVSHTYNSPGVFQAILEVDNGGGDCIYYDTITITVLSTSSIKTIAFSDFFKAYPNPVKDELIIEQKNSIKNFDGTINIYSNTGAIVKSQALTKNKEIIDFTNFEKGVYFISIDNKDIISQVKVIKL